MSLIALILYIKVQIFPKIQRKLDMIDQMVAESRKRRAQMASEETFEPIAIDFGFEDSVAFDSDKGQFFDVILGSFILVPSLSHR